MAGINISNLIIQMQQKINSTTDERDLLYYAKATQALRSGMIFRADTYNDLPTASTSLGELYWVVSLETLYIALPTLGWQPASTKKYYSLWTWGIGRALGDNTTVNKSSPVREITSSITWCAVCAVNVTQAIRTDGSLWSWGWGDCGNLGDNSTSNRSSPVREISSSTNWCMATNSTYMSAGVKTDGTLWGWGSNCCGSIGDNTTTRRSSPVREISSGTTWCSVSTGPTTVALKSDGSLWAWGRNCVGTVGDNSKTDRLSPVREFSSTTMWCAGKARLNQIGALKTDGTLWMWGAGANGALGTCSTTDRSSPVQEACGSNTWRSISVGNGLAHAIKSDFTLWSWGCNTCGRLGDGTTTDRSAPTQEVCASSLWCTVTAGICATGAVRTNGTLWMWGRNYCGILGTNSTTDTNSPVQEITQSCTWYLISSGTNTAAIKLDCSL